MYRNLVLLSTIGALIGAGAVASVALDDGKDTSHRSGGETKRQADGTAPARSETGRTLVKFASDGSLHLTGATETQVGQCRRIAKQVAECRLRYEIDGGSIHADGLVALDRQSLLAIRGGTGRHDAAGGTVTMRPHASGTLQLEHDVTIGTKTR